MLTPSEIDSLPSPIVDLYQRYEDSVLVDIARRIGKMKFESASWQVQRLSESGLLYDEILKKLSALTGESEATLRKIFVRSGVHAIRFDDSIYKLAGLDPLPLNLSPAMSQVLAAGLSKTMGLMRNLTLTTAMAGQDAFIQATDLAYMQISSGAMSYDQAIKQAVKDVASNGLPVIQYAGKKDQLDVAIRRAALTGVSQTVGKLQEARADEMNCDLVQTSAHAGARPSHQEWQGKIFSRSGANKKYPDFVTSTGYGTGPGLCGWNCRHSFFPFFEGISQNAYDREMLNDLENKKVKYQDEEISLYDATQVQRGIERKIRYWKRQADVVSAVNQDNFTEMAYVKYWQSEMRKFINQTGLSRQRIRETI